MFLSDIMNLVETARQNITVVETTVTIETAIKVLITIPVAIPAEVEVAARVVADTQATADGQVIVGTIVTAPAGGGGNIGSRKGGATDTGGGVLAVRVTVQRYVEF